MNLLHLHERWPSQACACLAPTRPRGVADALTRLDADALTLGVSGRVTLGVSGRVTLGVPGRVTLGVSGRVTLGVSRRVTLGVSVSAGLLAPGLLCAVTPSKPSGSLA